MFDQLAEELKKARLKNHLTLQQLAARTRIDLKFLEAIEEGNLSFLPDLYVKAFMKEYAGVVGLDPEIIIKKYEAAKEGLPYEEPSPNLEPAEPKANEEEDKPGNTEEQKHPESDQKPAEKPDQKPAEKPGSGSKPPEKYRKVNHSANQSNAVYSKPLPTFNSTTPKRSELVPGNKNAILVGATLFGAIILIGLIYLLFFNQNNEIVVPEKPYDEVVTQSRQRYEESPAQPVDSMHNNAVTGDSLNLLIQARDTSWIKLILDNTKEEEFILFPNSQKSLKAAKDFKITFGKSSAIKLQLNNKPLEFKPRSNSVSHVKISSNGIEYLNNPPRAGQEQ